MRNQGRALVITLPNGRVEHPVTESTLVAVVERLASFVDKRCAGHTAVWTVEAAS